jgi:hypothetical protein
MVYVVGSRYFIAYFVWYLISVLKLANFQFFSNFNFFSVLKSRTPTGPGEMGQAVVIPESKQDEMRAKFKINQFNLMASDLISVNRSLRDVRMDA